MPRKFSVIDAETDPFDGVTTDIQPFVWGMYDERGFRTFPNAEKMVEVISKEKRIFYAHNGGKFDFHFLLNYANTYQEITVIHGRIAKFHIGEAEFRDSYCILPEKLDKIAEGGKIKIDYEKFKRELRDENFAEIVKYLEGDCYKLYMVISDFLEEHPERPLTLAGAAMNYWAKHFNAGIKPKIGPYETAARYYKNLEPWYFGGRVECMEGGIIDEPISTWDINSAYPAAMLLDHPAGPAKFASNSETNTEQKFFKVRARGGGYFAQRKKNGGIFFPNDGQEYIFNVTGWEMVAAIEMGAKIDEILEVWEFPAKRNFVDYVNHFWKIKNQSEKGSFERLNAKLMLNSLYGKFGANPANYQRVWLAEFDGAGQFAEEMGGIIQGTVGDKALIQAPLLESQMRYYDVATAISITGCVRASLMRVIFSNDGVYCDTDCIHVRGIFQGDRGDGLGQWQPEFKAVQSAYAGPKLYALKDKHGFTKFGAKGVSLEAGTEFETIKKLALGETFYSQRLAPTFSLKNGRSFNNRNIRRTTKTIEK